MLQRKNWPICKPLVRHSIAEDVPPSRQRLVRLGYFAWLLMFVGFCWNWLVILIMYALLAYTLHLSTCRSNFDVHSAGVVIYAFAVVEVELL